MSDAVFGYVVEALAFLAALLRMNYEQVFVLLFCVIGPAITGFLIVTLVVRVCRNKELK